MATKIAISIGHLQEIRQQKSSALAFSAKASHKLEEPINNLFHTIQTTCGLNARVFMGKPTLCYQASHHCMTGQNRDSFPFPIWGSKKGCILIAAPQPNLNTNPPSDADIPSDAQDAPPSSRYTNPVASSGRSHASQWASSATSSSHPSWNDTSCR